MLVTTFVSSRTSVSIFSVLLFSVQHFSDWLRRTVPHWPDRRGIWRCIGFYGAFDHDWARDQA